MLEDDAGSYAGAAHSDELGLQAVVVALGRGAPHPPQEQRLEPDGLRLQTEVLHAVSVQAAFQRAAGLCDEVGEAILIVGDAVDDQEGGEREREREREKERASEMKQHRARESIRRSDRQREIERDK